MRIIMIALITLFLSVATFGQENKQPEPDPDSTGEIGHPISVREILDLPRRDEAPKINLKQALKIAEKFIGKQQIDISSCYLFEAKWVSTKLGEESSWYFWWVRVRGDRASGRDIKIIISNDGKPQLKL